MTQSPTTALRAAIAAPIAQFTAAFSRGDAAGAAAMYTADGQVLPPNSEIVSGKQAIQTFGCVPPFTHGVFHRTVRHTNQWC